MKGTYCLVINVESDSETKVGSLGKLKFEKGHYVYVGSAFNNLENRIARHLKSRKQKHWHVDYLLMSRNAVVEEVFYKQSEKKEECKFAKIISRYGTAVTNFGSSDCDCKGHLFKIDKPGKIEWSANGMRPLLREDLKKRESSTPSR